MTDYTVHQDLVTDTSVHLVCFFKKIQDWILNPKESKNRFCVSLLNRSIRDLSDHGALKEPKNLKSGFFGFFDTLWSERSSIDLFGKERKIRFGFFWIYESNLRFS